MSQQRGLDAEHDAADLPGLPGDLVQALPLPRVTVRRRLRLQALRLAQPPPVNLPAGQPEDPRDRPAQREQQVLRRPQPVVASTVCLPACVIGQSGPEARRGAEVLGDDRAAVTRRWGRVHIDGRPAAATGSTLIELDLVTRVR